MIIKIDFSKKWPRAQLIPEAQNAEGTQIEQAMEAQGEVGGKQVDAKEAQEKDVF